MPRRPLPPPILSDEQAKLDQQAQNSRKEQSRPFPPEALPDTPRGDLARAERRGHLGIVPRRSLWPELAGHDQRGHELQQLHSDAVARLQQLTDQRQFAPERDAEAIAKWIADGKTGARPASMVDHPERGDQAGRA